MFLNAEFRDFFSVMKNKFSKDGFELVLNHQAEPQNLSLSEYSQVSFFIENFNSELFLSLDWDYVLSFLKKPQKLKHLFRERAVVQFFYFPRKGVRSDVDKVYSGLSLLDIQSLTRSPLDKVNRESPHSLWLPQKQNFDSIGRPCLFLDRDGVINKDFGYVGQLDRLEFYPQIFEIISHAHQCGHAVIVVTNQSGVARDYFTQDDVLKVNQRVALEVKSKSGVDIEHFYVDYSHPQAVVKEWCYDSYCRKPWPGHFLKACYDFNISLEKSLIIGDKPTDRPLGINLASLIYQHKSDSSNFKVLANDRKKSSTIMKSNGDNFGDKYYWQDHDDLLALVKKLVKKRI